ncbi:hypothetical protein HFQ13_06645 [Acidithiobacillus sp. VAN18-1]|uniref:Uncharacterized protein n=1 Tax=Igneacidithiobacillus copahuensis TaxID=2724909 RepID=A0AAE3CJL3_9PROT|nr:hypothetical protein [Igneacidithiobacillus copahuensis]MBU2787882.1 hypothetical protein [Igneacidithiobacillus copahuensis]MBU2795498.1 hypothetical protein [Acidithiobacillus sp. VAN18-2]
MALSLAISQRTQTTQQSYTTLAVQYRDGLHLNYLFDRSTRVTDLMAAISRAGRVRKVVLWDECPASIPGRG